MRYPRGPDFPGTNHFPYAMAFQDVILTQKIEKLGAESDIVRVRAGYARNFLIPSGKALEKTGGNLARLNRLKSKRAEREAQELNESQEIARKINKLKLTFELETVRAARHSVRSRRPISRRSSRVRSARTLIATPSSSRSRSRRPAASMWK
jgi:hypothetical protein